MSIKSIKEKQLLVNLAKSFGQDVDPNLVAEVEKHKKFENNIRESIRSNIFDDLSKVLVELKQEVDKVSIENNFPLPPSLDELDTIIQEEKIETNYKVKQKVKEEITYPTLSDLASESISASVKRDSFQQTDQLLVAPDINSIQKKIRYLEHWISKVSEMSIGGGAGSVAKIDHETKLVTTSTYDITTKDFYIGVNYNGNVSITLPSVINVGRMYIIKDESGNCSVNPITVLGTVDNDTGGFILQQNNGSIQLIYRNGWRII